MRNRMLCHVCKNGVVIDGTVDAFCYYGPHLSITLMAKAIKL